MLASHAVREARSLATPTHKPPRSARASGGARAHAGLAVARAALAGLIALVLPACGHEAPGSDLHANVTTAGERHVEIIPRTPELATFPCSERCHNRRTPNPQQRQLREFHAGREIHHGPSIHWCDFCHQIDNIDQLRLIDGTIVSIDEEYRVCQQCHPARVRDWEHGIHGLQTGSWRDGETRRRQCGVCHDPHDPHRPTFQALPPPQRDRAFTHE